MHLSLDIVFCVCSFLEICHLPQVLQTCKEWCQLDEQEAFWRQTYVNLLAQELQQLSMNSKSKAKRAQISELYNRHIVKSFYREKGRKFKLIVQKQLAGFATSSSQAKIIKAIAITMTSLEAFQTKWDTILSSKHLVVVKPEYYHRTLLHLLCYDLESVQDLHESVSIVNVEQQFLQYYAIIKQRFPNMHLAHIFKSQMPSNQYDMPFLFLLRDEHVFNKLFGQFLKDLTLVPSGVHSRYSLLQVACHNTTFGENLPIVKQIVESGAYCHAVFNGSKETLLVEPLMRFKRFNSENSVTVKYLEQVCLQEFPAFPTKLVKMIYVYLNNDPDSKYLDILLQQLINAQQVAEVPLGSLMVRYNALSKERFDFIFHSLIKYCNPHDNVLFDAFSKLLCNIRSNHDSQRIISILEQLNPKMCVTQSFDGDTGNCLFSLPYDCEVEVPVLEYLLQQGANPNCTNQEHKAAFFMVQTSDSSLWIQFMDTFGKYGADFSIKDNSNSSILDKCNSDDAKEVIVKYMKNKII